jgi:glycosyltransferase involved in cell wall biosynthesis
VQHQPDIDIVLPCYNPPAGWEQVVLQHLAALRERMKEYVIRAIIVDDGSGTEAVRRGMASLASAENILLLSYPGNMGKGFAIRYGVSYSTARVIAYTDIDFPYTTESIIGVITPVIRGNVQVALAVRNKTYYTQLPTIRRWMSHFLKFANRHILRLHTSDTQGGLKAFDRDVRDIFLRTRINRYLFDLEFMLLVSRSEGVSAQAVEADLREGIVMSPVRLRIILGESLNFFKVLLNRSR